MTTSSKFQIFNKTNVVDFYFFLYIIYIKQKTITMANITEEKILELMDHDSDTSQWGPNNVYIGLQIIAKYTKKVVHGADHDIIYSEYIKVLIEAGITEEDVKKLCALGWMIHEEEYFAHFT
jgi:hypothetical protein